MGTWGCGDCRRTAPARCPYPSQANHYPLVQSALTQGGISPRPLVPTVEPDTASHPSAARLLGAIKIFANLANPHPCLMRPTSHIMARVPQHLAVGEHRP